MAGIVEEADRLGTCLDQTLHMCTDRLEKRAFASGVLLHPHLEADFLQGGFDQLNWFINPQLVTYARYDWITGSTFNDTAVGGITFADPRQHDYVAGIQYAPWPNVKLIGEYRYRVFEDRAVGNLTALTGGCVASCQPYQTRTTSASIVDNGFTARLMMGF